MKRFLSFFLFGAVVLFSLLLLSCGRGGDYADGIPCGELLEEAEEEVPVTFGYESLGREEIEFLFGGGLSADDVSLRYSKSSENINEIGIFHSPNEEAQKKTEEAVASYLAERLADEAAFLESYAPGELLKLKGARWRSFGSYTAYAVLEEKEAERFFEAVEKELLCEDR